MRDFKLDILYSRSDEICWLLCCKMDNLIFIWNWGCLNVKYSQGWFYFLTSTGKWLDRVQSNKAKQLIFFCVCGIQQNNQNVYIFAFLTVWVQELKSVLDSVASANSIDFLRRSWKKCWIRRKPLLVFVIEPYEHYNPTTVELSTLWDRDWMITFSELPFLLSEPILMKRDLLKLPKTMIILYYFIDSSIHNLIKQRLMYYFRAYVEFPRKNDWNFCHLIFFDKRDESSSFDFHRLSGSVVEGDDEVEEVGLAQVRRGLLLEVGTTDARSNTETKISKAELKSTFQRWRIMQTDFKLTMQS